jgi:hypothetical protein
LFVFFVGGKRGKITKRWEGVCETLVQEWGRKVRSPTPQISDGKKNRVTRVLC